MSYDYAALAAHVQAALEADPRVSLRLICQEHQVDRHTVNRALDSCLGVCFSDLKSRLRAERIRTVLTDTRMKPIKQAAADAGYRSSAALAKQTRKTLGLPPTAVRRRGRS